MTEDSIPVGEELSTNEVRLEMTGQVTNAGEFEVFAITAGIGNGYEFTETCLQESLNLWDGVECFVDHSWFGHSVRDLAGVMHSPAWDPNARGIKMTLKALGPSGSLLAELARQVLAETGAKPNIGFSADLDATSKARKIERILKVRSVDLVFNPARGGAFIRALNSVFPQTQPEEVNTMGEENQSSKSSESSSIKVQIEQDQAAVRMLLDEQTRLEALAAEAEEARKVRLSMCSYLLEAALSASKLPKPAQEHVRQQFAGKVFEADELTKAIEATRQMLADSVSSLTVQGPGRVSAMFSSEDQLQAAVDDMFGVARDKGKEEVKPARLSGIRELYLMLTGDYDLHGGYHADQIQLATTADFTGLVKNAMNKIVVNTWDELGRAGYDWWKRIVSIEHFDKLQQITGVLVGTVGSLPTVAEGGEYTELPVGDSPETADFVKYGGYIPLSLELIDRDDTRKLRVYPRELASAGLRTISSLVAAIFTANSGVGPTLADTGALFNATAVTTAGGHANLLTAALASDKVELVKAAVYNQPMLVKNSGIGATLGVGPKMAIDPKYLLVPRALQLTAMQILYPSLERASQIYSENMQRGEPGDVVTVPEWTDTTDWAMVCDPRIAPAIYVGERFGLMPQIFIAGDQTSPAVFMNDETRLKVRHFLAVWVNDYRPLHKENV